MTKNIFILKNISGRTHTNAHMTNSDLWDTIVNETCQYYSGTIIMTMIMTCTSGRCNRQSEFTLLNFMKFH